MIFLEPRSIFDKAIKKEDVPNNRLVYCRNILIDVLIDNYRENEPETSNEDLYFMDLEHIEYNIESSSPYYKDWPLIEDSQE